MLPWMTPQFQIAGSVQTIHAVWSIPQDQFNDLKKILTIPLETQTNFHIFLA
jgi:hypothetical protein